MFNRKKLDKERMEIYLVHLFLSHRVVFYLAGILISISSVVIAFVDPKLGIYLMLPAMLSFAMAFSFRFVLFMARFGSWLGTFYRRY